MSTLFICPTHDYFNRVEFAESAVWSFFRNCKDAVALVVDDGTFASNNQDEESRDAFTRRSREAIGRLKMMRVNGNQSVHFVALPAAESVARAWNYGLDFAARIGCEHVVLGSDDILFSNGWRLPLLHALSHGVDIVGPASNAPGTQSGGAQAVSRLLHTYRLSDSEAHIDETAEKLRAGQFGRVFEAPVSDFCVFSKTSRLLSLREQCAGDLFDSGETSVRGLTDTLLSHAKQHDVTYGVVPASFVFHYRSSRRALGYKKSIVGSGVLSDVYRVD